jgi:cold-inducible RNA-binding protein
VTLGEPPLRRGSIWVKGGMLPAFHSGSATAAARNSVSMTVVGESPGEFEIQEMIQDPAFGNMLPAEEACEITPLNSRLHAGNMSLNTAEDALRTAFGQSGSGTGACVANDRETGRPRGFAFVTFATEEESRLATERMNGVDSDGRQLTVKEVRPKEKMGGGGAGRSYDSPNRRSGAFQARGNSRY